MTTVLTPCPGRVLPLSEVPDPVFAAEMVGPGVAVDPPGGPTTVVSPIAGTAVKVLPHAFVVLGAGGVGVLVHLGINTVRLEGRGFEVLVPQGSAVEAGTPMVRWDPAEVARQDVPGLSTVVPVVVMDRPKGSVAAPDGAPTVADGEVLFTLD